LLVSRGTASYLRAKLDGCPEERLQQLRDVVDAAAESIAGPAPEAPSPEAGAPPLPGDMGAEPIAPGMSPALPEGMPQLPQ
jgi:hypothetical protein